MMTRLKACDGHVLDGYLAVPSRPVRGGVVIAQEMYGLTRYLTAACDFYASQGYLAIAPALYDRREQGLILAYDKIDHDRAQVIYNAWDWELALNDLDAGKTVVLSKGAVKVGIVGFCWGGSLAWLAACRREYSAAVAYYGSKMPDYAHEQPRCPVIALIGDADATLPAERIAKFREGQPSINIKFYKGAKHGFDNSLREERYHAEASEQARRDTLEFLAQHVASGE